MVKFSKQFEAQIVPEWKEAFFDYFQIKKDLKKFHLFNSENSNNNHQHENSLPKSLFSTLMKKFSLQLHARHRVIQVHRKLGGGKEIEGELYETELFEQLADSEAAIEFFHCLDFQLNKVNQFYKAKEKEFLERGDYLNKQMDILMELNDVIKRQQKAEGSSSQHSNEDDSISVTISDCDEEESTTDITEQEQKEQENSTYGSDSSNVRFIDTSKPREMTDESEKPGRNKKEDGKRLSSRVFNFKGKKKLRIHVPLTNPIQTFSEISYLIWDDLMNKSPKKFGSKGDNILHINRKNIKHAEKTIRGAFIDLYKGLGYLTTYRKLNILAFVKILEKFDKVTNKQVLPIYLRVVETSYFNSSDKVLNLSDEVEEIFVSYFAKDDKREAMKYLKPEQPKESHTVTFFLGLFSGCFLALLVGYVIMAHITGIYQPQSNFIYMETAFPILSMFSLLFLHVFLYGCNMYMWRKTRINYSFIFDLSSTKELKYRDVFLICAKSMTAVVGVLFLHLFLYAKGYNTQAQAIPGILLLVFLMVLVCPCNIMYKSSRYRLLSVLRNIILSPLYKVVMLDFFMADQLCSQIPMLRNLEYIACYYITGSYKTQDYGLCMRNKTYMDLAYAVSFLPYYWRAMQCARRWFDEGQKSHLVNLGKYVSAMLAAGAKVAYEKERNIEWFCILVIVSSCATLYQLYWDFVKDWGLLQFNSKNPWLRDDLMLSKKYFYYFSMALNLILRLAWLQTVFPNSFGNVVDYRVTGLFLAALEIVRRCQWNFYRLENEHLNNAGKFRAVNTVPLPFHEVEDED